MDSKPFILFITGTSAAGKTTLYEKLKKDPELRVIIFHDMDENGIPQVGRDLWRQFRVEELLYNAITDMDKGLSSVICGMSKPHEVIESRYYRTGYDIHFLLVDAPFEKVRERLLQRIDIQTKKDVFDESFGEGSEDKSIRDNEEFKRILVSSFANQKKGHVIDTSKLSVEDMYEQTKQIIRQIDSSQTKDME